MTEFIHSYIFYITAGVIYFILLFFTLYKLSGSFRNFVSEKLLSITFIKSAVNGINKTIEIIGKFFKKLVDTELIAGRFLRKAETFLSEIIFPALIEPINIAALILRKIFTDNIRVIITFSSLLIVAFYIILTIL